MPPKKQIKRTSQEPKPEAENPPVAEENTGDLTAFINSLPSGNQDNVVAIVDMPNLPIGTKLEYLEEYLTVGQLKTCRRLLEEQCSNFKQFLSRPQVNLVERMIIRGDFAAIQQTISGNPEALEAFQNYLKYNGHVKNESEPEEELEEEEAPKDTKKPKDSKKSKQKNGKKPVESSEDEESTEEEDSDSEEDSDEQPPKPTPTKKGKNKKAKETKESVPANMDYEEWRRLSEISAARGQAAPTPLTVWDMADKAAKEINELNMKVTAQEKELDRLKMELQSVEQLRKTERDELNRYNEQKLQEASKNYLDELKRQEQQLKEQHTRELAAVRQQTAQNSLTPAQE